MRHANAFRRADRFRPRPLIHRYELLGFRRAGVRHSHQLDERIGSREMLFVGGAVKRIAQHWHAGGRQFVFRAGTHQRHHFMPPAPPAMESDGYPCNPRRR